MVSLVKCSSVWGVALAGLLSLVELLALLALASLNSEVDAMLRVCRLSDNVGVGMFIDGRWDWEEWMDGEDLI